MGCCINDRNFKLLHFYLLEEYEAEARGKNSPGKEGTFCSQKFQYLYRALLPVEAELLSETAVSTQRIWEGAYVGHSYFQTPPLGLFTLVFSLFVISFLNIIVLHISFPSVLGLGF